MEVNKLDEDELRYECQIRGICGIRDNDEMKSVLRGVLKVDAGHEIFNFNLDSSEEIKECIKKIQELKLCIDSIDGDRFGETYRKADTKLSHLLGRIDRISTSDDNLRKKRSTLLKTILYLMREMESKVGGSKPNESTVLAQHSGTLIRMQQNMSSGAETKTVDEGGQEIFIHQGVALKNLRHDCGSDNLPTGTLTIVQYKSGKWIEWKQTDVIFESDNTDAEWNLVDTVRRRTCSTSSNADGSQCQPTVRLCMRQLRSYKIKRHGRQVSLMCPDGQHYSFLFQCGSGESFINALRAILITRRHPHIKNLYTVNDERDESRSMKKSFNELNLFPDQGQAYTWNFVKNLHNRPYETTMQTFSKLTDIFLYRPPENRPLDQEVAELLSESLHPEDNVATVEEEDYAIVDELPSILPPMKISPRGQPLTKEQWNSFLDEDGKVKDADSVKRIIFKGGVDPSVRCEAWKYLLGFYPWNYSKEQLEEHCRLKEQKYMTMKNQWKSFSRGQEERFSAFRDRKSLIEKDVCRTDRTLDFYSGDDNANLETLYSILMSYVMYNFDLGYVQGMSDLLSPILYLLDEEISSFWCFVGFMYRVERNFDCDQAGMKKQLADLFSLLRVVCPSLALYLDKHESANMFFCFRWLLVWFKREFTHTEIMTIWEVLWTDLPCPNFHLIICAAILDMHKERLMEPGNNFTDILKYVNELSCQMNVDQVLSAAEAMYEQLNAVDDKLPLAIRRTFGFAPSAQDDDSDNSEDDFGTVVGSPTNDVKKRMPLQKVGALPGRIEPCKSDNSDVPPSTSQRLAGSSSDDMDHMYTGEIGFEGVERAMGLNYY